MGDTHWIGSAHRQCEIDENLRVVATLIPVNSLWKHFALTLPYTAL